MNALAIRETLSHSGPRAAERQLAKISNDQGDDQLSLIVAELTPGEVAMLLGEGDYTKPSTVTPFVTAAQFLGALERFGAKWGKLNKTSTESLLELKSQLSDFVLPVLLHAEGEHKKSLIREIVEDNLGEDVLVAIPLFEPGCPEFLREFDLREVQHGTWQELYADLQTQDPAIFKSLSKQVTGLFGTEEDNMDDEEETKEAAPAVRFLKRTLQSLSDKAAKLVEKSPDQKKSEDVFEDI